MSVLGLVIYMSVIGWALEGNAPGFIKLLAALLSLVASFYLSELYDLKYSENAKKKYLKNIQIDEKIEALMKKLKIEVNEGYAEREDRIIRNLDELERKIKKSEKKK